MQTHTHAQPRQRTESETHLRPSSTPTALTPAVIGNALKGAKSATQRDSRRTLKDPACEGLELRIGPRQATWTFRYRVAGAAGVSARGLKMKGKQTRVTLGSYPALSITEARAEASKLLVEAERGDDPAKRLEADSSASKETLAGLIEDFLTKYAERQKLKSAQNARWLLEKHFVPKFGQRPYRQITKQELADYLDQIAIKTPGAANEARRWIARVYSWAVQTGKVTTSPMTGVKAPAKINERDRVLSMEEARAVWRAASALPYPWGPSVQLLMLTAARRSEVTRAKRAWFDKTAAVIDIPASEYKTGRPMALPMVRQSLPILEALPEFEGDEETPVGDFLFSTTNGVKAAYWQDEYVNRLRKAATKALGRPIAHFTLHDLRRTAATHMARMGVDDLTIEMILGHAIGRVKRTYNRYAYLEERRAALQLWADELARDA